MIAYSNKRTGVTLRLRSLADWFDDPYKAPEIVVQPDRAYPHAMYTAGFLLRRIADSLEAHP